MPQGSDELRNWFKAIQPVYPELFNAAHLMCGNSELAEQALYSALFDTWSQGGSGVRQRVRIALRQEAFRCVSSRDGRSAAFTWQGIPTVENGDDIAMLLGGSPIALQRFVMLRYGCRLSIHAISRLTDTPHIQVRRDLRLFQAQCRRLASDSDRRQLDRRILGCTRRLLSTPSADLPRLSRLFRSLEADGAASGRQRAAAPVARVLSALLLSVMSLVCAGMFWLLAVLLRPI